MQVGTGSSYNTAVRGLFDRLLKETLTPAVKQLYEKHLRHQVGCLSEWRHNMPRTGYLFTSGVVCPQG